MSSRECRDMDAGVCYFREKPREMSGAELSVWATGDEGERVGGI